MSERLARAGLISLLGGATGAVFGLVLAVVVGRGLGPAGTGYFFQTVAIFMILANVLELGADTGLVRSLAQQVALGKTADLRRTVGIAVVPVVVVGVVVLTAIWLSAPWVASVVSPPEARATTATLLISTIPFVLAASLVAVLLGGTRGLGSVVPFTSVQNLGLPIGRVVVVGLCLASGFGIVGTARAWAWPFLAAVAVSAILLVRRLAAATAPDPSGPATPTRVLARDFWVFSGARGVAAALEIGLAWASVLIVAALRGPIEAGIFAVVSRCILSGLLVETAARLAVGPRISAALSRNDSAGLRRLHLTATQAMILLSWPFYLTLACFAPVVLSLFGDGFGAGAPAMVVLCGALLLLTGAGVVQSVLLMGGKSHWQMNNKAIALAINVVGNLLLVPVLGLMGAAVVWTVTIVIDSVLATWQVHRLMAVRIALRELVLPIGIVLGSVAVPGLLIRGFMGATPLALMLHLVLGGTLFIAACWRMRSRLGLEALSVDLWSRRVQAGGASSR